VAATFGQAITVHKSQGSQWDRVLVVDESGVFANIETKNASRARRADAPQAGHLAGQRWLYTAITRAAKQVAIVPRIRGVLS
jgi:exodeoxyribonuclease-5